MAVWPEPALRRGCRISSRGLQRPRR